METLASSTPISPPTFCMRALTVDRLTDCEMLISNETSPLTRTPPTRPPVLASEPLFEMLSIFP